MNEDHSLGFLVDSQKSAVTASATSPTACSTATPAVVPPAASPAQGPEPAQGKTKPGRRVENEPQKRDKVVAVYFTRDVAEQLRFIAPLKRKSVSRFIEGIVLRDLSSRYRPEIEIYRNYISDKDEKASR